jgi:hypothetical protein
MAKRMVIDPQSGSHKKILSYNSGQTKAKTGTHTENDSCAD